MQWTRSNTLALATHKCVVCRGSGLTLARGGALRGCDCVLRGIFRVCYNRFRQCVAREKYLSKMTFEIHSGPNRRGTWGRKQEEYVVDFLKVAKRTLTEEEYRVFKFRFLLGADWKLCLRQVKMDRGNFFHAIYRIQTKLGQAFSQMEPYSLYPLDEYFGSGHRSEVVTALIPADHRVTPIRPPLMKQVEVERQAA